MQPNPPLFLPRIRLRAFSLLELSIVIIIVSIMIAAIVPVLTQNGLNNKQTELQEKMDAIETALIAYRVTNNRLPCPAGQLAANDSNFGTEASIAGTCTGGTPAAVSLISTPAESAVVAGLVPVKTLGLDQDMAYDPWGRAFSYVVDQRITANDAFTTYDVSDVVIGNIKVTELNNGTASTTLTTKAILAIISYGVNGHGGYLTSGSAFSSGSTNAYELKNCFCTAAAVFNAPTTEVELFRGIANATNSGATDTFDDDVRYFVRSAFITNEDISTSN